MRAVVIDGAFGLENLKIVDRPEPTLSPGQVLVRMRAASLNYRDVLMVRGQYNPRQRLPLVPGSDGVGEVVAIAPGVEQVQVGDRVCPIFASGWLSGELTRDKQRTALGGPNDGTLVDYMALGAEAVVKVPDHLSDEEAACLPCAGVTAWSALVSQGKLKPGDVVLTQGSGGVASFCVQLAKLAGAQVIATSSSDAKLERLSMLGADHVVNYRNEPEWGKRAKALTDGRGVDHVVDLGGARTLAQSLKAVRPGGCVSIIGNLSGNRGELDVTSLLMQNVRLQGVFVGARDDFEALTRAVSLARIRPVVDRVFELERTAHALEYLGSGAHFGKVCVRIAD
jgi:NADPH:quinone reductase-like Zn-dependent oxidoreductase